MARIHTGTRTAAAMAALAAALPWATLALPAASYIAPEYYRDLLTNNLPGSVDKPYSAAMHARLRAAPAPAATCAPAPAGQAPRSVILLVVESLSAYHSALLSGLGSSTPELDKLAQAHSYFPHFYANGFTTDGGLIALLTARAPLPAIGRYHSTHVYAGYEQAAEPQLMAQLHTAGYQSGFFTTGDLGFLHKGRWLQKLGFAHVEGHEHPAYASLPRGAFGDTGDNTLYTRYLQWYDHERQRTRPVFSVLLTVSTHPPFHVPGTAIQNEAQAFAWADAQLGQFVQALKERGYFQHGVLVITGDHRAMTFVQPGETQRLGPAAAARVPAVVIGPAGLPPGPVPGHWQQTDFLAGLQAMAGLPSCTDAFRGRLLGPAHAPAPYVLQVQGARRDHIAVLTPTSAALHEVQLNGDRTGWAGPPPPGTDASQVIDHINRERAALSELPHNVVDLLLQGRTE
ncbi:MAG: LTA synthase family protein [Pseudomonadota bacterium]|nr:LTA synthase family protein [Pseudomonadota bacterium]